MTPRDGGTSDERPQHIVVVGDPCSGKSILAERLAGSLDAPYVELDALFWRPDWVAAPLDEFDALMQQATNGERWVVAGNYNRNAQPNIWPRAQCVVWLDLPLYVILPRLLRRTWRHWRTQELLWGANTETFWRQFKLWDTRQSLVAFVVGTHLGRRRLYVEAMRAPQWQHIRFVRLRSPQEVEAFARGFDGAVR